MKRKWIRALALAMTLSMALGVVMLWPLAGSAAEMLDWERGNSLTISYPEITLTEPSNSDFVEDLKEADVVADVYLVAEAVQNVGYDGYHYETLAEPYAGLLASEDELFGGYLTADGKLDMDKVDEAFWQELAQAAAKFTFGELEREHAYDNAEGGTGEDAGESGGTERLIPGHVATIAAGETVEELKNGLYLVIPHGAGMKSYDTTEGGRTVKGYAVTTEDGSVAATAYSDTHGYAFEPMLISLPTKDAYDYGDGDIVNTGNPAPWIYEAALVLKAERLNGELGILKILPVYENSDPATFVFSVKVTSPIGEKIYDDVLSLTFTAAGWKELKIGEFPAGSTFEIEEIYSGSSYEQKGDPVIRLEKEDGSIEDSDEGQGLVVIGAARKVVVEFENEYDYRRTGGHGITNHFSYDDNGWVLTQYPDNAEGAEGTNVPGNPAPEAEQPGND